MGILQDIARQIAAPTWRPDEDKFCWACKKKRPHKWEDGGGFISIPKWRCKVCGKLKRATLWEICK